MTPLGHGKLELVLYAITYLLDLKGFLLFILMKRCLNLAAWRGLAQFIALNYHFHKPAFNFPYLSLTAIHLIYAPTKNIFIFLYLGIIFDPLVAIFTFHFHLNL